MRLNRSPRPGLAVLAVLALLALLVAACSGSKVNQDNFNKIQVGMSQAQVKAILGEATESSSLDIAGFSGTTSTWRKGEAAITIQFVNGKVVAKQFAKPHK
jgi:hypothetical protein